MKNEQKGFSLAEIMLVLVFITLIGFIGWYVMNSKKEISQKTTNTEQSQEQSSDNSKYKTYQHPSLSYSFQYPSSWTVEKDSNPQSGSNISDMTLIISPDVVDKTGNEGIGIKQGASMTVLVSSKKAADKELSYYLNKGDASISNPKSLTVSGESAVQYNAEAEGPALLTTLFYHNGLRYFIHTETASSDFQKYLPEYDKLVKSFKIN